MHPSSTEKSPYIDISYMLLEYSKNQETSTNKKNNSKKSPHNFQVSEQKKLHCVCLFNDNYKRNVFICRSYSRNLILPHGQTIFRLFRTQNADMVCIALHVRTHTSTNFEQKHM